MDLFALQKTLALLILPAGLVWLLLWGVCLLALRRQQRALAGLLLGIALLYGAAGNIYLGAWLMARLEAAVPPVAVANLQPFDAVFVLGGGSDENAWGSPQLGPAGDRVFQAAKLWHAGKARLLVTSGMSRDGLRGIRDGAEETRTLWLELGVPDSAILVVKEPCWITRDELSAYRKLHDRFGWKRMALVSSASHLPRAMGLAAKAGLRVTPVGANWLGRPLAFRVNGLVPQAIGFNAVQVACWEFLGRWMGR